MFSGFKLCVAQHVVNMGGDHLADIRSTLPALSLDADCPNGEGSMLRYFLGDEVDGATGMHLRLLGDAGLISGSKSMVLFRVAPHAITLTCQKLDLRYRSEKTTRRHYIPAITFLLSKCVFFFFDQEYTFNRSARSGYFRSYR